MDWIGDVDSGGNYHHCQQLQQCDDDDDVCMCCYSDMKIAAAQSPKDISQLASEIGLLPHEVDFYGKKKAKVSLKVLDRLSHQKNGNYVIVTGSVSMLLGQFLCTGSGKWVIWVTVVCAVVTVQGHVMKIEMKVMIE